MRPLDIVNHIPLLRQLSPAEREALAQNADHLIFSAGTAVIRSGETTTDLWVIGKGEARAVRTDGYDGKVTLNTFRDGDYFGEMSFIDGEPRSATVEAVTDMEVMRIPRSLFERIVENPPAIASNFMKDLSAKIRRATRQIDDLVFIVAQEELHNAHLETIHRLALAAEYKDGETGAHLERVSRYSGRIAKLRGLSDREIEDIRDAAPMHDIGKIGIPENILRKPGPLTDKERKVMQSHTLIGERILSNPGSELMLRAREIAGGHHERFDGKGYPRGLQGEAIPVAARIIALADVFDALTTKRPYKRAFSVGETADMMGKERGGQFDPELLDLFMDGLDDFVKRFSLDDANKDE